MPIPSVSPWGIAAEVGGGLVSSAVGVYEAEKNRQFQLDMSNTAHQREVKDLRAAGLNPILSAGGSGASTGSGAMFTPDNPARGVAQASLGLASKGAEIGKTTNEADRAQAEQDLIAEQMKTQVSQQKLNSASAVKEIANARLSNANVAGTYAEIRRNLSQAEINSAQKAGIESENVLKKLDADIYNTPFVGPAMRVVEKVVGPAATSARGVRDIGNRTPPTYQQNHKHQHDYYGDVTVNK